MKREHIEKATAVMNGIKLYKQELWHKPEELPKKNSLLLVEDEREGHFSIYKIVWQDWKEMVRDYSVRRWCYIEDLLPDAVIHSEL